MLLRIKEVKVAFDNFVVNQGQLVCPETSTTPTPTPVITPSPAPISSPTPAATGVIIGKVVDAVSYIGTCRCYGINRYRWIFSHDW